MPIDASNTPGPLVWVTLPSDLANLHAAILGSSEVVVDLETTGLDMHAVTGGIPNGGVAARIVLASFTLPQRESYGAWDSDWDGVDPTTYVVPLSHPRSPFLGSWRRVLREALQKVVEAERPVTNANVKFDARWTFAQVGVDLSDLIAWDTQVSSHLLDENASTRLKDRAPATFGIPPWDDFDLSTPGIAEKVDLYQLGEYAARDTYWTWRLAEHHRMLLFIGAGEDEPPHGREEIQLARLGTLATWVAMPMVASLTKIEQRGFRLDVPWVREHLDENEAIASKTLIEMAERYELPMKDRSSAPTSNWFKEFTARAVDAGDLVVAGLTPQGSTQWTKGILLRQARRGSAVAQTILDNRKATKRAEYLRSWLNYVTPDGFIHTTYWPGRVVTGRLSSTDPNVQQIEKFLKPAFIPRDERNGILDADYSQIELRIAAFVARCLPMLEAFRRGDDLHRMLAARLAGKAPEDVTGPERNGAKPGNFGLLYGMSAGGFQEYAETNYDVAYTEAEAVAMHHAFFELWEGMAEWHAQVIARVHRDGYVTSPLGRIRRLPDIWDGNPYFVGSAERKAINSPVQSFASDVMQMAAASMQGLLFGAKPISGIALIGTVHDDIIGEVPLSRWREVAEEVRERMVNLDRDLARMGVHLDVPLEAGITVGTRWGLDDVGQGAMS